ncbi:MAG: FAD-dependent oxidoreductase [Myxococcales bacterium]|nr:FAD-dependent oxidoreductase [Myxococcales bacterium]
MPTSPPQRPVVVLGAGLTGLSAAYHLRRPTLLVEQQSSVGGHTRSVRRDGFVFDMTGHWLHLRDPQTRGLVAGLFKEEELVTIERRTRIVTHGVSLAYPFQANLHGLPLPVVQECLVEFLAARERAARGEPAGTSFQAYAEAKFGRGIARHFFVPYNAKMWGEHSERLTAEWVSRFVPLPDPAQVIGGALGLRQDGLGYNAQFVYPAAGGIDGLPERLRAGLPATAELRLGCAASEVDPYKRKVRLAGAWHDYAALVSTIPLPVLIGLMPAAPPEIRAAAGRLKWLRWRWLDVALRAPPTVDWHWAYVPEPRWPFFRVGVYSNALAGMAPPGCGSLYVELADRDGPLDVGGVIAALVELGVVGRAEDVLFAEERRIEYAYVVFDDDHAAATADIQAWLRGVGVRSCGRYGAWTYNSMEDSVIQGREAAAWAEGHVLRDMPGGTA